MTYSLNTSSRAFACYTSIREFFVNDAPIDVNAQMLLQDLNLTKNSASSSESLKSWEGSYNGANTTLHLRQQLFALSSFHLTEWQTWHISYIGGSWWWWTCSWKTSSSPIFVPTNHSARRVLDALGGVALIPRAWMLFFLCHFSSSFSARSSVLPSNYPRFSLSNSRMVWTSACQRSSALKRNMVLHGITRQCYLQLNTTDNDKTTRILTKITT